MAVLYLAIVTTVGVWAARRTRSAGDFFIAGQKLGWVVTAFATMSAAFSGFVFMGGPGLMYRIGVASLLICISVGFTSGFLCWVVGKRLRLLAGIREVFTVPDAIYVRYGSRRASGLAAIAVIIGTIGYLGAQLQALGILIEMVFGTRDLLGPWSLPAAMILGCAVVVFYATAGGMVAGVYTDLIQGVLMVVSAVAVFFFCLQSGGGLTAMSKAIITSETFGPNHLDPFGTLPVMTAMGFFFVFAVGLLGQPHMLHKFFMLEDPRTLKWMPLVIGSTQSACVLIWLGIGVAVPALVAQGSLTALTNPDQAAPQFLFNFTPPGLAALVLAGVLAAIMSTADSFLNIGSAALVRDLPKAFGKHVSNQLLWGRVWVIVIAVIAMIFAFLYGDLIALIGTFAFGTFAAALAPAVAIGLNWRRVTSTAATASIAAGMVVNLGLEFMAKQTLFQSLPSAPLGGGMLPSAVALLVSFTVLLAVTWLSSSDTDPALEADVDFVMDL